MRAPARTNPDRPNARSSRTGIAAVELAVALPLLMVMVMGLLEVGRLVQTTQVVANAAREGARRAACGINSLADVNTVVLFYLRSAGIPLDHVHVTAKDVSSGTDFPQASQFDVLQVTVTVPYDDISLTGYRVVSTPSTVVSGSATWLSLRDKPYPSPPEPAIE